MPRQINDKIDALFVEGPDDGALVNALVKKLVGIDLARHPSRVVRTNVEGGGAAWAVDAFQNLISTEHQDTRVGLIIDRDNAINDNWPMVSDLLRRLGFDTRSDPTTTGAIVQGRHGIWMWPDNVSHGDLEDFVVSILPQTPILSYAPDACRIAKDAHGAEYEARHSRKAALKVRSVWRDASAAGGYGHLVRNLALTPSPASDAFIAWFTTLFLT